MTTHDQAEQAPLPLQVNGTRQRFMNSESDEKLYPRAIEWTKTRPSLEIGAIPIMQRFFIEHDRAKAILERLVADGHVVPPLQPGGCYQPAPGNGTLLTDKKLHDLSYGAMEDLMGNPRTRATAREYSIEQRDAHLFEIFKTAHQAWAERAEWGILEWQVEAHRRGIIRELYMRVWDTYNCPF